MERIGIGRVGISHTPANHHISLSIVIHSSSSSNNNRWSKPIGEGGRATPRLPGSLSTIVIDRLPKLCLRAFRPKRSTSRTSNSRGIRASTVVVTASPLTSASPPVDPNGVLVSDPEHDNHKPQTRTRSRTRGAPRRKRKSSATAIDEDEAASPATTSGDLDLQRVAEALENAYHKDAPSNEVDNESILRDLEAQTRGVGERGCTAEMAVSCSAPTVPIERKRRGRPRKVRRDSEQQPPAVISLQTTEDGLIARSGPSVAVEGRVGEGKCRLNLVSRIALRKRKQDRARQVHDGCRTTGNAVQDIWSEEAENLILKHGLALDFGIFCWDHLKRGLLSADEETKLAILMKPMKTFENVRIVLTEEAGRDPTDEEWAAGAKVDLPTLRRHLLLGNAARNKLIQHNLRLVLFQAHKYHREGSCLALFDLCQEGVLGLLQGVQKFDPQKGHRFSTYAVYWVRNSILRAQTRSGSSLRSPYNVAMHKLNIRKTRLDLLVELERAPTDEEVMKRLGLAPERYRHIMGSSVQTRSMNKKSERTGEELVENLADRSDSAESGGIQSSGDDASVGFGVNDVLDSLKPRERLVLRQRFGLDGRGERTLGDIGEMLGLSREMVRKYEASALLKMKLPTRMEYLRSYLS